MYCFRVFKNLCFLNPNSPTSCWGMWQPWMIMVNPIRSHQQICPWRFKHCDCGIVMLCCWMTHYWHFGGWLCLHLNEPAVEERCLTQKIERTMILCNVSHFLLSSTEAHCKTVTQMWEPEICPSLYHTEVANVLGERYQVYMVVTLKFVVLQDVAPYRLVEMYVPDNPAVSIISTLWLEYPVSCPRRRQSWFLT
jgi:hypothetical protein